MNKIPAINPYIMPLVKLLFDDLCEAEKQEDLEAFNSSLLKMTGVMLVITKGLTV